MSVQIIINGENAAESLKELSTLAAGLVNSGGQVNSSSKVGKASASSAKESLPVKEDRPVKAVAETKADAEQEEAVTATVEIKIEDLRALCKEKNTSTEQNKLIKATIAKYGGGGLPNVPESDYAALKAELESL